MKEFNLTEVRELELFTENDGGLYDRIKRPIELNMRRKLHAGKYNHEQAIKGYKRLADEAAKEYSKQFSDGKDGLTMFSVADRWEVAKRLADSNQDEMHLEVEEEAKELAAKAKTKDQIKTAAKAVAITALVGAEFFKAMSTIKWG